MSAHPIAYTTIAIMTFTTVFFGAFAREQICIYACPWPRIQAAMMDEETLTVGYRHWRGEPRGKGRRKADSTLGDCIDCMACVNVCPVGIDIRDGQQLECITCALCIDACDEMMEKVGKPRGLIDYLAVGDEAHEVAGNAPRSIWKHHFLRPRTILYTALWSLVGVMLTVALFMRSDIDLTVAPVRNPIYVTLSDGTIRNTYEVRLRNKHGEERPFAVSIKGDPALEVSLEGAEGNVVNVPADQMRLQRVYVTSAKGTAPAESDKTEFRIWVEDASNGDRVYKDTIFNGRTK